MTRTVETKGHRDFAAERSDSRCRNRINARLFGLASEPMLVLPLRKLETTTAAADDNADPAPFLERQHLRDQFRVLECLTCGHHRQCRGARDVRTLFRTKEIIGIGTLDFTGNLNGEWRRIEGANAPDTASSIAEAVPELVPRIPNSVMQPKPLTTMPSALTSRQA